MTGLELAQHLYRVMGDSARDVLAWTEPIDDDALTGGPFETIIELVQDTLDLDDIEDGKAPALRAIGRWKLWEYIADNVALDVDEAQGDRNVKLSQLLAQAERRATRAYWDSLKHQTTVHSVKRYVIQRKPLRFDQPHGEQPRAGRKGYA